MKGKGGKSKRVRVLKADAAGPVRVQAGAPVTVKLKLSKKQRRKLLKSLRGENRERVEALVTATGAGGGTERVTVHVPRAVKK
jgi:hypothetical protein